jgi:hypothetical protein
MPATRRPETVRRAASRFRRRRIVSSLWGMPRRRSSLSAERPPVAYPIQCASSLTRLVRLARANALYSICSAKLCRATVVAAPPPSHMNHNANRQSLHGQILQMAHVRSLAAAGRLAAIGALIRSRAYSVHNQRTTTFNNVRNLNVGGAADTRHFCHSASGPHRHDVPTK